MSTIKKNLSLNPHSIEMSAAKAAMDAANKAIEAAKEAGSYSKEVTDTIEAANETLDALNKKLESGELIDQATAQALLEKIELLDKIVGEGGLEGLVVEQTYNPISELAQAGKAVAEAIAQHLAKDAEEGDVVGNLHVSPEDRTRWDAKSDAETVEELNATIVSLQDELTLAKGSYDTMAARLNALYAEATYTPLIFESLSFAPAEAYREMGNYILAGTDGLTFSYLFNKTPDTLTLNGVAIPAASSGAYTYPSTVSTTTTFTVTAADARVSVSKQVTITFVPPIYYGVAVDPGTGLFNSGFFSGDKMGKRIAASVEGEYLNLDCSGENEYIFFFIPSGTDVYFKVGGFVGGFDKVTTIAHQNEYGYTANYDVYRSTNGKLGVVDVEVLLNE